MKKLHIGLLVLFLGLILLSGCTQSFNPPIGGSQKNDALQQVIFLINSPEGRTLLPAAPSFDKYRFTFTANDGQAEPEENPLETDGSLDSYSVSLAFGSWTVVVEGLIHIENIPGIADGYYEGAVSAPVTFDVNFSDSTTVNVTVNGEIKNGIKGLFSYAVSFPDDVIAGALQLQDINEQAIDGLDPVDLTENRAGTIALNPGYYFLKVELENADHSKAYKTEIMHIYSGLTTTADSSNGYAFTAANFAPMKTINGQVTLTGTDGLDPAGTVFLYRDSAYAQLIDTVVFDETGAWSARISTLYNNVYLKADVEYTGYALVERTKGPVAISSNNIQDWTINCLLPNTVISIGDPSVKLYLNGSVTPLINNSSTILGSAGVGLFTVSIDAVTYTEIKWFVNGNLAAQGTGRTSIILPKRTAGIYRVTVEATAGGVKNTGTHSFVIE
jgi:hypothetical protein